MTYRRSGRPSLSGQEILCPGPVGVSWIPLAFRTRSVYSISTSKEYVDKVRARGLAVKKQARITSKGQITVPHEIRRAMGVRPGDKLVFEKDGSGVRIRPVRTKSPFEIYRGIGSPGIRRAKKAVVRWVRELRGR